jgi:hypothetical protein
MARTALLVGVLVAAIVACFSAWLPGATSARTTDATMRLTVSSGGACDGDTCTMPLDATFALDIEAGAAPAEGYAGIQTELSYANFLSHGGRYVPTASPIDEFIWPSTVLGIRTIGSNAVVNHAATPDFAPPYPTSTYEGVLVRLNMRCSEEPSSSTFTLIPYASGNSNGTGFTNDPPPHIAAKVSPLTVVCGEAPPTPTSAPPTSTPAPPTATTTAPTATTVPPTATPATQPGDVNCNGVVNAIDAAVILQYGAGLIATLPCPEAADLNGDGRVNAIDAAILLQSTL